ncbi:MAG: hypothetical protein IK015_11380 [Treponema sp.]|nr:hypothetical protein [Treponema sp.]
MQKTPGAKFIQSLFDIKSLPKDAQKILQDFDQIAQAAMPANSKQLVALPKIIRELSHQMTDDRGSRRLGYMNEKTFLSAYVRYFMWWNLVRLTRLFANLDFGFLRDGDVCLDIGSGPLTLVCALWLARPDLRDKKLVWYAMDISQLALSAGEEIFLSVAAATGGEPWKIIRVKGELGTAIKQKAAFVTCANMFNEILQKQSEPPDYLAKKYSQALFKYLDFGTEEKRGGQGVEGGQERQNSPAIFLAEPGTPGSGRFVSLMRDSFIRRGLLAAAPCPHQCACPMDGRRAGKGGATGKWCNFAFETDDAPKKLLALSAKSGIPKERAVLSFVMAVSFPRPDAETLASPKSAAETVGKPKTGAPAQESFASPKSGGRIRIASDIIRVPAGEPGQKPRVGHYACSERGLVLALSSGGRRVYSGDLLELELETDASPKSGRRSSGKSTSSGLRDAKSGAIIVEI